ncbi:MAG: type II secretion system ATPase GspE [Legionellaceae bacterium]|nr:type II secretion system ATPase GspE [Legionellaceae bacterium]
MSDGEQTYDDAESTKSITKLPYTFAKQHGVILEWKDNEPIVYHLPQAKLSILTEIQRLLKIPFKIQTVDATHFQETLAHSYQGNTSIQDTAENINEELDLPTLAQELQHTDLLDTQDDAPIIRLINAIFQQAIQQKASDIHVETYAQRVLVRFRMDGILTEVLEIQRAIAPLVTSRIKVMAKLDIAEKRIPQDGRIALLIGGHPIDVRVSTLPSNHGERIVLRILDKQAAKLDLRLLGMPSLLQSQLQKLIAQPHGLLLVTGPTGSGKTTSLYAMLTELNQITRNILTIEDPIEYDIPGIGQTQVNSKIEMTFAKGLRAILRQDPDVVMVGEIRDLETAQIAIQASLTGHLVISTLHTNTAIGAISRLQDMGVEPFLLASSTIGLLAQRLVRVLCDHCKKPRVLSDDDKEHLGIAEIALTHIWEPQGCSQCNQSGYKGRTGLYELIVLDEPLRAMIHRNENATAMAAYVRQHSASLRSDGFQRVAEGITSISEVLQVTSK